MLFRYFLKVIISPYMNLREKADGLLLLFTYTVPSLLALARLISIALFFLGEMDLFAGWWVLFFIEAYTSFGNFAPFFEIGTSLVLDGVKNEALLLIMFNFCQRIVQLNSKLKQSADIKKRVHQSPEPRTARCPKYPLSMAQHLLFHPGPNRTYTPAESDAISHRLQRLEHETQIIWLTGFLEKIPLQEKLAALEQIYNQTDG